MLDFQQKRKVRGVIYSRVTIGVLLLLVLVVGHSTWSVYRKKKESGEIKNLSLGHVEELRSRDKELELKINKLDTIPGIEEEIRSKFSVVKENEKMAVIVEETSSNTTTTIEKTSFWKKVKEFFIGK